MHKCSICNDTFWFKDSLDEHSKKHSKAAGIIGWLNTKQNGKQIDGRPGGLSERPRQQPLWERNPDADRSLGSVNRNHQKQSIWDWFFG